MIMKEIIIKYNNDNDSFQIEDVCYGNKNVIKYIKNNKKEISSIKIEIDFTKFDLTLKIADKIILFIKKVDSLIRKYNIKVSNNIIKSNSKYEPMILTSINVCNFKDKKKKNDFLYDEVCDYLDNIVVKNNVCGFKNNVCVAKRGTGCKNGCCHHFKNKRLGILYQKKLYNCEYQKDKRCTAKCITCKMYMCDYLRKRGYSFTMSNVLIIKRYFNILQKLVIKTNFFTTKEDIMKKLNLLDFKI